MDQLKHDDQEEYAQNNAGTVEKKEQEECMMCNFVFAFAFSAAFLVIVFTYFFKLNTTPAIEPLPVGSTNPVSLNEWQEHIAELKNTADGNMPTTTNAK